MSLQKHTFKMLKCHFTQDEMTEFRDKLANSIMDLSSIEDEKKSVMSDYTARINEKKAMINRVASNIRNGYEHREVKCRIDYDFSRRVKTFAREDTGEIVQEEIITADESQQEIPGLEPIGDENQQESCEVTDIPDDDAPMTMICRCASECEKSAACKHGTPHEKTMDCHEPTVCYDIQPSRKIWCELVEDGQIPVSDEQTPDENEHDDIPAYVHPIPMFGDDFVKIMNAAKTADEAREIISVFEERLNKLQRVAGVDPVCGSMNRLSPRGFSTLSKKEVNTICKEVSKADPGIGMIHTAIVEQWPAIQKRWDELLIAEREQRETEN